MLLCLPLSSLFSYHKYFFPFHLDSSIISNYYQELFPQVGGGGVAGGVGGKMLSNSTAGGLQLKK